MTNKIDKALFHCEYNDTKKKKFKSESMKYLRTLAKILDLPKSSYEIRFNAGGIAVSGDAILHHDNFYINISHGFCVESFGFFRKVKGQLDYVGGYNNPISEKYINDVNVFADKIKLMFLTPQVLN